jgi:hypothetical protein
MQRVATERVHDLEQSAFYWQRAATQNKSSRQLRVASSPCRRCLQLLSTRRRITGPLDGKVEVGGGKGLAIQGEVPEFHIVVAETPSLHETQQHHAVTVRCTAHVGVGVRRFVEAVETAAHVDAAWQRRVKGATAE